jgi:hypothetical protein
LDVKKAVWTLNMSTLVAVSEIGPTARRWLRVMEARALTYHSSASNEENEKEWSFTSTSLIRLHAAAINTYE